MAEFQELIRQKKRMCSSVICFKSDIYRLCCEDVSKCPRFIISNPKKAEEVIMAWAKDHPEPVYPTWGEYLKSINVLYAGWDRHVNDFDNANYVISAMQKNIPAPIAEALKLKPVNQ